MADQANDRVFELMTAAADKTNVDLSQEVDFAFDPKGSGYDKKTAEELMELWPLTMTKPDRKGEYDRETVEQKKEAFQAWVWHEEDQDWVKHGGSLDPRTGMLLKGMEHKTIGLTLKEEERLGTNKIIFKEGRYYSVPKDKDE